MQHKNSSGKVQRNSSGKRQSNSSGKVQGNSSEKRERNLSGRGQRNEVPLRIVYEDDFLIVVEKREGLLSVGTVRGKEEVTAHSLLNNYVRNTAQRGSFSATCKHSSYGERGAEGRNYDKGSFSATGKHSSYGERGAEGRNYAGGKFSGYTGPLAASCLQGGDVVHRGHSAPRVYIVHRLDRETSGLMVFAKSEEIKHALQENWENVVTKRCYVAVVNGIPDGKYMPPQGTIRTWLKENSAFIVYSSPKDNGGQLAITNYKVLGTNPSARKTLMELELDTGRKNQIRVHMQEMGMPIFGDKKYYGENPAQLAENKKARRLYLHAYILNFIHPVTGKEMKFTTGIPRLFHALCSLVED